MPTASTSFPPLTKKVFSFALSGIFAASPFVPEFALMTGFPVVFPFKLSAVVAKLGFVNGMYR